MYCINWTKLLIYIVHANELISFAYEFFALNSSAYEFSKIATRFIAETDWAIYRTTFMFICRLFSFEKSPIDL